MARLSLVQFGLSLFLFSVSSFQSGIAAAAQLTVRWKDNSLTEAGFKVERKTSQGGAYAPFTTTGANTTSILDPTLTAGVLYCYRVYAFNSIGKSAYSNEKCNVAKSTASLSSPSVEYNFNEGTGTRVVDASGNQRNGTISGATWTTQGKYGKALSFNGGTARVLSGLRTNASVRSFLVWTKRTGPGGGNFGRIFDKRTSNNEVELLYNDSAAKVYRYVRQWSGGVGNWTIPQPSPNVWHHIAVVYNALSAANAPQIYVDGIAQVVTKASAPRGTPLTNTDPYVIGNRGAGDRGWNGVLDDFRIYYVALTSAQIQTAMMTAVSLTTSASAALDGTSSSLASSTASSTLSTLTDTSGTTSSAATAHSATTIPIPATVAYAFDEGAGSTVADATGNNWNGTVEGATWTTAGEHHNALSFDGAAASVTSGLNIHGTARSYLLWTNRNSAGGGNFGRIFDKQTDSDEVELFFNDEADRVYRYVRMWSGGVGRWIIPQPTANMWHHIAVVYDASSATNNPQMYVDGVAQVVTQETTPIGTPLTNTAPYIIGNNGTRNQGWSGVLDDWQVYDIALTAEQIQAAMTTAVAAPFTSTPH